MTFGLFDSVTALESFPEHGIRVGSLGAIVEVFSNPTAYYVEFCNDRGETLAMIPMREDQIALADLRKAA